MSEAILIIFGASWMMIAHLRYARANYPDGWRWRVSLFVAGAFVSSSIGWAATGGDGETTDLLVLLIGALLGGVFSAWAFPVRMQYIIPRRRED
jgi:hypothetical protein